jgi:hypothetical protein
VRLHWRDTTDRTLLFGLSERALFRFPSSSLSLWREAAVWQVRGVGSGYRRSRSVATRFNPAAFSP